ncbi:MAG: hypothetical protein KCHDKBKB_02950 [Elusimicrobia bacterium]|nr:hypothetical protein [Elusimicrobiota bacterium]
MALAAQFLWMNFGMNVSPNNSVKRPLPSINREYFSAVIPACFLAGIQVFSKEKTWAPYRSIMILAGTVQNNKLSLSWTAKRSPGRRFNRIISVSRVLLSLSLFLSSSVVVAEQPLNAVDIEPHENFVGEATQAVVGRVFGVEGEASDIKYHVFELTHHSPTSAAVRSLFIPGWGQHFNQQPAKGSIFFVTTVGALLGSMHLYNKADESYQAYTSQGVQNSSLYDDYEKERLGALLLGGTAGILWVVGIFDAYRQAYSPLYSKDSSVDVALKKDGAQLIFKKSF